MALPKPPMLTPELTAQLLAHAPPGAAWVTLRDGYAVYTRTWQPPAACRAVVVWVHGLGEHVERYDAHFQRLAARGIAVHAWDQRGFGRTALRHAQHGHNGGWATVLDDVGEALDRARSAAFGGAPVFLAGQSMGGLIVLDMLRSRKPNVAGVIAMSPAVAACPAARPPAPVVSLLKLVRPLVPKVVISNAVDPTALARCDAVAHAYAADPLVHSKVSLTTGNALLGVGDEVQRSDAAQWPTHIPVLIMHGTADEVTHAPTTTALVEKQLAGLHDRTLKLWEGYRHELHNEPEIRDQVVDYWCTWILDRLQGPVLALKQPVEAKL